MVTKKWMEALVIGKNMKYFTKEWCFSKLDDQEIEHRLESYRNYVQNIYKKLPFVLKLLVQNINLHDGKLETIYFSPDKKNLILRGVFGDLESHYFELEIEYLRIKNEKNDLLDSVFKDQEIEILSDEIEVLSENLFSHRILFSTQKYIEIQFEDIKFKIQNANPKDYEKSLICT